MSLPDYRGCLNLLQAHYSLWWRDAKRNPELLEQLADWIDQPIDQVARTRPALFYARPSACEPLLSAQENRS